MLFKLRGEFILLGEDLGLVDETEPLVLFALFCLSWVALVPLTKRGEVTGEEDVLGLVDIAGFGANGGGMVALFIGGE